METKELAEIGILGAVTEAKNPLTIDQMQHRLQEQFGSYWGFGQGVLQPAISRLKNEGYIQQVSPEPTYRITEEGKDKLRLLVTKSVSPESVKSVDQRHRLIIQFGFLHHVPEAKQIEILEDFESMFQRARKELEIESDEKNHTTKNYDPYEGYRQDLIDLNLKIIEVHLSWIQDLEPYAESE